MNTQMIFGFHLTEKDKRRDATFMDYYNDKGTLEGTVLKKFLGSINATGTGCSTPTNLCIATQMFFLCWLKSKI
jgi:hypothetical protein